MASLMGFPTRVLFGAGALRELPAELVRLGVQRPLVVVDRGVVGAGLVRRLTDTLDANGLRWVVFEKVDQNPVEKNVWDGVAAYRGGGCDGLIGLGGGSPLDAAKAVRLMVHHPPPISRYDEGTGGEQHVTLHVPPFVAIPTTAGTGSEVGRSASIILDDTRRKTSLASPHLLANTAILDPELTQGLPAFITAATGMDALTHNVESYVALGTHPFCDAFAIAGVQRIARHLKRAVRDGATDLEAREQMLVASSMGGVAAMKGLGAAHALAHGIGSVTNMHHGLANALVLPAVLAFNRDAARERLAEVAVALGHDPRAPVQERAAAASELVRRLKDEIGLAGGLAAHGLKESVIPQVVERAREDGALLTNPRPTSADDLRAMLRESW